MNNPGYELISMNYELSDIFFASRLTRSCLFVIVTVRVMGFVNPCGTEVFGCCGGGLRVLPLPRGVSCGVLLFSERRIAALPGFSRVDASEFG
jgi:hypothetical protein